MNTMISKTRISVRKYDSCFNKRSTCSCSQCTGKKFYNMTHVKRPYVSHVNHSSIIKTYASSSDAKITFDRKEFEAKRTAHIKENFNKFLIIGSNELKDYSDLFNELDKKHRDYFNKIFNKKESIENKSTFDDDNDENIFKDD